MSDLREGHRVIRYDVLLVACILLLTALGLVTLYSASYIYGLNRHDDGMRFLNNNLIGLIFGIIGFLIACIFPLEWLKKKNLIITLILLTVLINILPFLKPFQSTSENSDARRWIYFFGGPHSFQPSEIIKVILPIYLAYILDKNKEKLKAFFFVLFPSLFWTGLFCALILLQKNFSDTVFIAAIAIMIFYIGGIRKREILFVVLALVLIVLLIYIGDDDGKIKKRIDDYKNKNGYQIERSFEAVNSGGFWGKGIGQGTYKIKTPEVPSDFIFASYAEESGFIGVLIYFGILAFFVYAGFREAWRCQDRFGQILAFSLVMTIATQSLMNIAVVINLVPTTGITLPFVSSGGSSLMMTLVSAGFIINVSKRNYGKYAGGKYADGGRYV